MKKIRQKRYATRAGQLNDQSKQNGLEKGENWTKKSHHVTHDGFDKTFDFVTKYKSTVLFLFHLTLQSKSLPRHTQLHQ
jgi:hypothetical protein